MYLLRVSNRNTRTMWEVCSKLTRKTSKRRRCGLFIVNFGQISLIAMVFPLLALNKVQLTSIRKNGHQAQFQFCLRDFQDLFFTFYFFQILSVVNKLIKHLENNTFLLFCCEMLSSLKDVKLTDNNQVITNFEYLMTTINSNFEYFANFPFYSNFMCSVF